MGLWIFPVMGISLALTIVVEAGAAFLWNIRNPWDLALTGAVNLLTNPAVVAAYYLTAGFVRIWGGIGMALDSEPGESDIRSVRDLC